MLRSTRKLLPVVLAALAVLHTQTVLAFPTGGGGCLFCSPYNLGGSVMTFDLTSNDDNGLAPVQFNFIENKDDGDPNKVTGRLCFSGEIHATIVEGTQTGEATYKLLASDYSDKGVCYANVTQTPSDPSGTQGACAYQSYTYTLNLDVGTASSGNAALLDGRFVVDTGLDTTGPYLSCTGAIPAPGICNFAVGFNDSITQSLFPATVTLSGKQVLADQVLYADEMCITCDANDLGLGNAVAALNSKSQTFRTCEALSMKADWCNDLQSTTAGSPSCYGTQPNNPPIGGMNTAIGDFQNQDVPTAICVTDVADLRALPGCPTEIAIAGCAGGPGYITFSTSYELTTCSGIDGEIFSFSSADGGGTNTVNMAAIGANPDAPGYPGDNTIPPILPTWTAIVSTPDNQPNHYDFSGTDLYRVAFIYGRNNDDTITGSKGDDTILGGSGADVLNGNDGNDVLQGGDNADQLFGENGDDLLLGYDCNGPNAACSSFSNNGSDDDTLDGGAGNDCLDGGRGNDILTGGAGNDAFVLFGNTDSDTITDYTVNEDVLVDLTGTATVAWVKGSKKDGIPNVCKVTLGGNNAITLDGISSQDCNSSKVTIIDPSTGGAFPAQCAGHPYSFQ